MKLTKWIVMGLAATSVLTLTACSKKPLENYNEAPGLVNGSQAGASAQTYTMSQKSNFNAARYAFHINSLKAPSNQTYYFAFNSAQINPKADQALNVQANYLASHPNAKIRLQGNTDNRGSRKYNYGLGLRRDQSVAAYLEQHGVSPKQVDMISYGKERPAVTVAEVGRSHIELAWALNRRVNMVYTNQG